MRYKNNISDFWQNINKHQGDNSCWVWNGCKNNKGYGQFRLYGKLHFTHRLSFELINGPIEKGAHLCHTCDNPSCCNPDHLFLGNMSANMIDRVLKNRQPFVKLSPEKVRDIRKMHNDKISLKDIANKYCVSVKTISSVVYQETWKHVV